MKIFGHGDNWLIEDQLSDELLDKIKNFFQLNLQFLHEDSENYSTSGNAKQFWIKNAEYNFQNLTVKQEFEKIEKEYNKQIIERLKESSLLKENIKLKHNSSWAVIGEEGAYHKFHTHGQGIPKGLSTVLYLKMPENEGNNSNDITLILDVSPNSVYFKKDIPSIIHLMPKVGTLLIFPPHIPHGTYPQTKGIRHTFNLDYELEFDKKYKRLTYS